ncbi:MAG: DMP19 family protein [Bacteroidetes bacterium]|nr:DMP19 family protein [Bacteroidota bacterium]
MIHIDNLQGLLNSENKNSSIIELDNFIGEACNYGENMNVLTEPQKMFYINQNLEREINNGGFNQYFSNSAGKYAHETISSLEAIGAIHTAGILQKAIDQFPEKKVPKDRRERMEMVEEIEDDVNDIWEDLDREFYKYTDNLNSLNLEYIKKNKEFF